MAQLTFLVGLLAAISSLAVGSSVGDGVKPRKACPTGVHMFATPGHEATPGSLDELTGIVNEISKKIPDSTFLRTPWVHNKSGIAAEVFNGQKVLESNISSYVIECPNTPIVLLGYSEGGIITMNTLCGADSANLTKTSPISSTYNKYVIATITMGEETRQPGFPWDEGTCKGYGEFERHNSEDCYPFANHMKSYCDTPDPYCCVGGTNPAAHHSYPRLYDGVASSYVVKQYDAYCAAHNITPSTQ